MAEQYAYDPTNGVPDQQVDQAAYADASLSPAPVNGHVSPAPASTNGDAIPANGAAAGLNVIRKTLASWVGFSNLPNQVHRRSVR